jgi:hypothetical protein
MWRAGGRPDQAAPLRAGQRMGDLDGEDIRGQEVMELSGVTSD